MVTLNSATGTIYVPQLHSLLHNVRHLGALREYRHKPHAMPKTEVFGLHFCRKSMGLFLSGAAFFLLL